MRVRILFVNKYYKEIVFSIFLVSFFILAGCQHNKYAESYFNSGNLYLRLEENRQAINDYDKAIELNPQYASAYNNRGIAYARLGDSRQAIKEFDKSIELDPKVPEVYYNRAIIFGRIGDEQQAIENFKKAARLGHRVAQEALKSKGISW